MKTKQRLENTIGIGGIADQEGKTPPKKTDGISWVHFPNCNCEKCRTYYSYNKGKIKKITPPLYSRDRIRTLDCYEYIMNKQTNKFKEVLNEEL